MRAIGAGAGRTRAVRPDTGRSRSTWLTVARALRTGCRASNCRYSVSCARMKQPASVPVMPQTDEALERYRLHAAICKVLTDPKRLMLIDALRADDRSVGELAASIGVTLPNASQHLAVLHTAGLVERRRAGTNVVYRLAEPGILAACDVIHAIVDRRLSRRLPDPHTSAAAAPSQAAEA